MWILPQVQSGRESLDLRPSLGLRKCTQGSRQRVTMQAAQQVAYPGHVSGWTSSLAAHLSLWEWAVSSPLGLLDAVDIKSLREDEYILAIELMSQGRLSLPSLVAPLQGQRRRRLPVCKPGRRLLGPLVFATLCSGPTQILSFQGRKGPPVPATVVILFWVSGFIP